MAAQRPKGKSQKSTPPAPAQKQPGNSRAGQGARLTPYRFAPGQSGNPSGRPKGRSLTRRLRELLDAREVGGKALPGGKQVADLVAEVVLRNALKGDFRFIQELLDRVDGKVREEVDHNLSGAVDHRVRILEVEVVARADAEVEDDATDRPPA